MSDVPGTDPGVPVDALDHVRTDGEELLRIAVDHDLDRKVPSCPGWSLGDLVWHVGTVWNRWARVVADGVTSAATVQAWGTPERPDDELLVDWATAAHTALFSALSRAALDQPVWTWTGSTRDVAWVRRRMAHETAVHRWDAADTVGLPYEIPVALAVYDMCKSADRGMVIGELALWEKTGGRSGVYRRADGDTDTASSAVGDGAAT